MFPALDYDPKFVPEPSEQYHPKRVKDFIGDDTLAEIIMKSKWYINEIVVKEYSEGNVTCFGDAVHRHPPMNGLSSNTCIQGSFNLA
jgi:2-polyprenyl-6-methoxyphenol hydroxylase-like FAD-dependent oxidoreductase